MKIVRKEIEYLVALAFILGGVFFSQQPIYAQQQTSSQIKEEVASSISSSLWGQVKGVEAKYTLPYPGLLPDHPLYFLKVLRDRIIDFAVSDPLKKAEFTLLQADKRLSASLTLSEKRKDELAESTESKAANYLERTVDLIAQARKAGKNTTDFERKLTLSLARHEEEVTKFITKTNGSTQDGFKKTLDRISAQQSRLKTIRSSS